MKTIELSWPKGKHSTTAVMDWLQDKRVKEITISLIKTMPDYMKLVDHFQGMLLVKDITIAELSSVIYTQKWKQPQNLAKQTRNNCICESVLYGCKCGYMIPYKSPKSW